MSAGGTGGMFEDPVAIDWAGGERVTDILFYRASWVMDGVYHFYIQKRYYQELLLPRNGK